MKSKTSTIIIFILVIMLIAIGIFMFGEMNKDSKQKTTSTNATKEDNKVGNQIANEITENTLINETISDEIVIDSSENIIENTTTSTEIFEEEPKTAKEKAINIVKKDWGEDKIVDISIDGIDNNGNYIVAVRDSATTEAKAFYIVNTSNGTFTKKEMD